MAKQTLRELAKEHAQGNLDRESYKKSRAELIQGILSSEIPLEEIDYPPLVQPPEPEDLDDTQRKEEYKREPAKKSDPEATTAPKASVATESKAVSDGSEQPGSSNKLLLGILGVAVLAILAVTAIALMNGKDKNTGEAAANANSPAATTAQASVSETSETDRLIKEFLASKNWSSSQLDEFRQQWDNLDAQVLERSRDSLAMGQLTNAIYKQLLEEQALSGLVDDDSSLRKQEQLVEFAQGLGIEDNRIRLPEEIESVAEDLLQ